MQQKPKFSFSLSHLTFPSYQPSLIALGLVFDIKQYYCKNIHKEATLCIVPENNHIPLTEGFLAQKSALIFIHMLHKKVQTFPQTFPKFIIHPDPFQNLVCKVLKSISFNRKII